MFVNVVNEDFIAILFSVLFLSLRNFSWLYCDKPKVLLLRSSGSSYLRLRTYFTVCILGQLCQ